MTHSEVSLRYLLRILCVLSDQRRIGISDLALFARINHQRCVANITCLKQLGFVEVFTANNRKEIMNTANGVDFVTKLVSLFKPFDALEQLQLFSDERHAISISKALQP